MSNSISTVLPNEQDFINQTSQIASAISSFGTSSFSLTPTGTVTVNNGVFSVPYSGTAPLTTTATILCDKFATNQTGLSYIIAYSNGVATFTLTGTADGVCTTAQDCYVKIGNTAYAVTISGLPVKYEEQFCAPLTIESEIGEEYDISQDIDIDLSNFRGGNLVYPQGVSPAAELEGLDFYAAVYSPNISIDFDLYGTIESGSVVTISADTFPLGGANYWISLLVGDNSGAENNTRGSYIEIMTEPTT